jgi:hypothetical protein
VLKYSHFYQFHVGIRKKKLQYHCCRSVLFIHDTQKEVLNEGNFLKKIIDSRLAVYETC